MPTVTQFCIGLENRPGTLARLCGVLKRAKVSIQAISVSSDGECGWVRLVATPTSAARTALSRARYHFSRRHVLKLEVPHRPGVLRDVAVRLAEAGININYVYGSNPVAGPSSTLVLSVGDLDRAAALFDD